MTVRQRWWLDAAVVLTGLAIGLLLTARHSPIAWIGPGLLFGAIVGINWGRRRWPPPPLS